MKICAVVIAGGRSSRMGRDKAMIELAGKPLVRWVIERVAPQVADVAVNANDGRLDFLGRAIIRDPRADMATPLAGLHAALQWANANEFDAVLTVPCDSPFLPPDLVSRLEGEGPAMAASSGRIHFLTGLWPSALLGGFETANLRRVQDWARHCAARTVTWPTSPHDPFLNVNAPEDLAEAARIAAQFKP